MISHHLSPNNNYIKNLSKEEIDKIVNLNEPIPNIIKSFLKDNIPYFREKRDAVLTEKLIDQERSERAYSFDMPSLVSAEYRNLLALNFINKHPEYRPFIKEIIYIKKLDEDELTSF
ncbi:hypothetical protein [Methanobrevibacter sp. DSM 116169]|uniref:hypothetical protein n=1 Tax=Methanobrevibacter sp. DSM 116169 TaxID=3242727 RepID=UPI0038FC0F31